MLLSQGKGLSPQDLGLEPCPCGYARAFKETGIEKMVEHPTSRQL